MSRHRGNGVYDDDDLDPEEEAFNEEEDEDVEEYEPTNRKRRRSEFIDDAAEEVDEDEEEEDEDDEEYGGSGRPSHKPKKRLGSEFFDIEAEVDTDDEVEEDEEAEDDFINDTGADLNDDADGGRLHRRPLLQREDDQEDVEALERRIQARYARSGHADYEEEETTEVEQQALLPSVRDPKLWLVKCAIGREREVAVCLMQKYLDKGSGLQIRSVIALDHLKNYIYVEAEKEAHVMEACKGLRSIFPSKISLVPIKEMTDVLSVESKMADIARDSWVRMKIGIYKTDLAKVVDVDNVRQRVTVKLIPRIDLQALVSKMEGQEVPKRRPFVPQPRLLNIDEVREMNIRVERRRDQLTGDYFENIFGMSFRDGFLFKTVSMKSINRQNIQPTIEELEKFCIDRSGEEEMTTLSSLVANRKKGHFMKGDRVIVIKGDLKNLKGWVEKVDEDNVHIRAKEDGLLNTLSVNERELCKYFEPGNHVKVVSGVQQGATGMVISVEEHVVIILSDTTKEHIRVFADHVVRSSEVTTGLIRLGNYELHDLVVLTDMSFGVIIRVESDALQVLKGVPDRPEVSLVRVREVKFKIHKKNFAQDRSRNTISTKDIVKILEGPCKGKQGPVEHIYRGILFIFDRHHLEHSGFICAKSQSCVVVGGARTNRDFNQFASIGSPSRIPRSPAGLPPRGPLMGSGGRYRGGRGADALVGKTIKIRVGPHKGYRGRVVDVKGQSVRIELESQMKVVTVDRSQITDKVATSTPYRETPRYGSGNETPFHPSRTPLHPYMTPMRDSSATPVHDGMRTPRRDRAWNPLAAMTPARENLEDDITSLWGTSPNYQPGSPARGYGGTPTRGNDAPSPASGWSNNSSTSYGGNGTPRRAGSGYGNLASPYVPSIPGSQPSTPTSAPYLPSTPGQPMTPSNGGLDIMSPAVDNEGPWLLPDLLVKVYKPGGDSAVGVVSELLPDGTCRVILGTSGNGESITAPPSEVEAVVPRKFDRIKVMSGSFRGFMGKLIGTDGGDGIVKFDDSLDVKILDISVLGKLAPP